MSAHFFGLSDRTFRYSHTIGKNAYDGPGFFQPTDLAIGRDGIIYVVNRAAPEVETNRPGIRVVMTNIEEDYLGSFGGYGEEGGKFIRPTAIALDSQQNVYVSDEWLQRISIFDNKGQFLCQWGARGSANGQFDRPSGLAFDQEDHLYLVDSANHRVQIFTKEGKFLDKFGTEGDLDGQLNTPWGITIDYKGNVYVADWRNDRVQKFARDGSFLASFGSSGNLVGEFNHPSGVAVDQDGDIYVTDWKNHRVQVFTPEFRHITTFIGDATLSKWGDQHLRSNAAWMRMYGLVRDMSSLQRFWYPVAVAVDKQRRVIVVDGCRYRLQVYVKGEMLVPGYRG